MCGTASCFKVFQKGKEKRPVSSALTHFYEWNVFKRGGAGKITQTLFVDTQKGLNRFQQTGGEVVSFSPGCLGCTYQLQVRRHLLDEKDCG